jgi:hypothetical protein
MYSKSEKNYIFNISLMIIWFTCAASGIAIAVVPRSYLALIPSIKGFHVITGYIAVLFILIHLALHLSWIKKLTVAVFSKRSHALAAYAVITVSVSICAALLFVLPEQKKTRPHNAVQQNSVSDKVKSDN